MTQEQSRTYTKNLIHNAKSGKEITEAIINHFKDFIEQKKAEDYSSALEILGAPLFKE